MTVEQTCDAMEPRFGAAEFVRLWCTAHDSALNPYRRLEFCGWPIAWGDAALEVPVSVFPYQGAPYVATRIEVTIFLTTDDRVVTGLELAADAPREFASSPPDLWTTFLDEHDDLDAAAAWLDAVRGVVSPRAHWPLLGQVAGRAAAALGAVRSG